MKLQNYITEEEKGLAYYIPKIQAECKPFLKDIKNAAGTLFRDDRKNYKLPAWKKITRLNRRPLDTSVSIHNTIDDWFLKKFGWRARSNVLFCWPLPFKSTLLSNRWLVFPAGDYKYIWSKQVDDLWGSFVHATYGKELEYFEDNFADTYTDKNIKMSIKYENEIMVNCKYSYLVKAELMGPVDEMLGLNWQGAVYKGRRIP